MVSSNAVQVIPEHVDNVDMLAYNLQCALPDVMQNTLKAVACKLQANCAAADTAAT